MEVQLKIIYWEMPYCHIDVWGKIWSLTSKWHTLVFLKLSSL
jgi:hypothetical protein